MNKLRNISYYVCPGYFPISQSPLWKLAVNHCGQHYNIIDIVNIVAVKLVRVRNGNSVADIERQMRYGAHIERAEWRAHAMADTTAPHIYMHYTKFICEKAFNS